jgi:spermidine synthase
LHFTLYFFLVIILAVSEGKSYYSEKFSGSVTRRFEVDKFYYRGKTKFQYVECFHNTYFGKVLFLDKKIQSAQIDEYIYHESLVHPGLFTHNSPKRVLILGGGEGATLREILKHQSVARVTMVDIDRELVELCQRYLPEWSEGAFSNPKTDLIHTDASRYVEETQEKFDVVVSDLTEPLEEGPSLYLFTQEFFKKIFEILEKDGLLVLQAGSANPSYDQFYCSLVKTLEEVFPLVRPYWTFILSFGLPWGFILASKTEDPLGLTESEVKERMARRGIRNLKFYHPGYHKALFALPLYLEKDLNKGRILTNEKPFIWES